MEDSNTEALLEKIHALQQQQVELLKEGLQVQKDYVEMYQNHFERVNRINDKAEQLQKNGASMMSSAGKVIGVILVIIVLLIGYLTWLMFV